MPEKQNAIYNLSHQLRGHSYLHHDDEKKNAIINVFNNQIKELNDGI